jgi:hypothetical protein
VRVTDARGGSPDVSRETRGTDVSNVVPGLTVPEGALGVSYAADLALPGQVEIRYARPCGSSPSTIVLPLTPQPGRITHRVPGRVPAGITLSSAGAQVRVQVCFDLDGVPHFAAYAGGPASLAGAAVEAVGEFRADPPRVNGAAILQPSVITVAFQP